MRSFLYMAAQMLAFFLTLFFCEEYFDMPSNQPSVTKKEEVDLNDK